VGVWPPQASFVKPRRGDFRDAKRLTMTNHAKIASGGALDNEKLAFHTAQAHLLLQARIDSDADFTECDQWIGLDYSCF
jgi:hypothetical protein